MASATKTTKNDHLDSVRLSPGTPAMTAAGGLSGAGSSGRLEQRFQSEEPLLEQLVAEIGHGQ